MAVDAHLVVLGNGFDIDCDLPTQYGDFLDFVTLLRNLVSGESSRWSIIIDSWCNKNARVREGMRKLLHSVFDEKTITKEEILTKWGKVIERNAWIDHFMQARAEKQWVIGENWVDFESEIAQIVSEIELTMRGEEEFARSLEEEVVLASLGGKTNRLKGMLKQMGLLSGYGNVEITYFKLRKRLLDDLNKVREALQTYLLDFVEKIDQVASPGIKTLCNEFAKADNCFVLSFNYTHTFETLFSRLHSVKCKDVRYCYLHGKARNTNTCDIVLGIDEHYPVEEVGKHLEFLEFRKYFQRIYYANDTSYLSWSKELAELAKSGGTVCMSIYGHSLALTDKDVLCRFILMEGMRTTSYYHSRKSFAEQIVNMTALINPDELMARTGDDVKSIQFRPQG